jgi:hypothetical protein
VRIKYDENVPSSDSKFQAGDNFRRAGDNGNCRRVEFAQFPRTVRNQLLRSTAMLCTYLSRELNSETPGRPYVVDFSIRVFSNKGMWQISSTSR